jgi:2-oxoglutarate dehydrogenase complex dehydrogenase (E1) component-like enzyme
MEYAGREAAPAAAVGYYPLHHRQQTALVDQALTRTGDDNVEQMRAHAH